MENLLKKSTAYQILNNDKNSGRLSHAYLLIYNDPVYLKDAMIEFSKIFFGYEKGSREDKLIGEQNFSDCIIYPKNDDKIKVDTIKELVEDSILKPVEADKKVYLIVNADKMNDTAQNKLLKILEEPPESVYFLLGAVADFSILPTVKSRVKTLEIRPFDEDEVYKFLLSKNYNGDLKLYSSYSGGVLSEAEKVAQNPDFREVFDLSIKIASCDSESKISELSKKADKLKNKNELWASLSLIYRQVMLKKMKKEVLSSVNKNEIEYLADELSMPTLIYAIGQVNKAEKDVFFNAPFQMAVEDLMINILREEKKWKKL